MVGGMSAPAADATPPSARDREEAEPQAMGPASRPAASIAGRAPVPVPHPPQPGGNGAAQAVRVAPRTNSRGRTMLGMPDAGSVEAGSFPPAQPAGQDYADPAAEPMPAGFHPAAFSATQPALGGAATPPVDQAVADLGERSQHSGQRSQAATSASSARPRPEAAAPQPGEAFPGTGGLPGNVATPGMQQPAAPPAGQPQWAATAEDASPPGSSRRQRAAGSARSNVPLYLIGLLAVGLLVAAGWLWRMGARTPDDVQVSVVSTEQGEAMLFRVLDAQPGAVVQFGDQEQPLKGGEARFPLSTESLVVGDNVVVANVVYPDGENLAVRVPLHMDYRLHVDTAPLRAGKSRLDVVIAVTKGTAVFLDGEPVELDAQGRGIRAYPVDTVEQGSSGVVERMFRYRVEPPRGEPIVGELRARVAVTMLQLDSPGKTAVTDADSIQLAGAVARGTRVTVDGTAVAVNDDGRFLHVLPLPRLGNYEPQLVAQAPDKAPLALSLDITRVQDLAKAAESFEVNTELSYAQIAQNPTMYKGQHVAFEGRVFNVKTERGRGVLQMLVRDCVAGRQCSLWVTYPATTRIANDSWVRVVGTVDGQQQFRSRRDEIVTVPKVRAVFVLPSKP